MRLLQAFSTSIGTKVLIAVTGLGLTAFLITHLAGNLLFLAGPEAFNRYAHTLTSNPLIYVAEAGLLAVFFVHIAQTVSNYFANRAARPVAYTMHRWARTKNPASRKSWASTTMIVTGTIMALFVVTHLQTFKFGPVYVAADGIRDLYRLQMEIFGQPGYVVFYLVAMALIFSHLWHGIVSATQSLGWHHPQWTPRVIVGGRVLTVLVAGGFFLIPIYTFLLSRSAQ